jgi:hypothetical protein
MGGDGGVRGRAPSPSSPNIRGANAGDVMHKKHILALPALLLLCAPMQACMYDSTEPDDVELNETIDEAQQALSYRIFYVSNPNGKSNKLQVTASIPSGTGKVYGIHIFDISSPYSMMDISCGGVVSCSGTRSLPAGCINYGSVPVTVDYSGSVAPKLTYWFTDC